MCTVIAMSMTFISCSDDDDDDETAICASCSDDDETANSSYDDDDEIANSSSYDDDEIANSTASGRVHGHEFVDLGLSVKWATCNIGAEIPSDYGDYFAWGEITTKSEYTSTNSITYGKNMGNICGDAQYDAATANWGGSWRLPTREELKELKDECAWRQATQEGHDGYEVIGKNGESIFLPAAGCRNGTTLVNAGTSASYWSGTPDMDDVSRAYALFYYSDFNIVNSSRGGRSYGRSVRPVTE